MMHIDQRKQQFSFAYIRAVAAAAGFAVSEPSVDDDSVDLQIASRGTAGTIKRPRLELQAKCMGDGPFDGETFGYPLKLKNYHDLRDPDVLVPRVLVVVRIPSDDTTWLEVTDDHLLVRHCGYWCSLRGRPETTNDFSVTATLPRNQPFDVAGLRAMMSRIESGDMP